MIASLLSLRELGNIVVIVTNPRFILPWVHEKFTDKFTMSNAVKSAQLSLNLSIRLTKT